MKILYNLDITDRTTFGVKVKCAAFAEYGSASELMEILSSPDLPIPFFLIGGGSNLLFTRDFPGTVLHSSIRFIERKEDMVEVGSGVVFDDFCGWAAENGLWGVENLSHIPGEVGASAVQNVGAYGVEAGDLIKKVKCVDLQTLELVEIDAADCRYAYRYSRFKDEWKGRYAIVSVLFQLSSKPMPKLEYGHLRDSVNAALSSSITPMLVRDTIINMRRAKLPEPSETGSAGSFFKNPVVSGEVFNAICSKEGDVPHYQLPQPDGEVLYKIPAAWMIERCGWKGKSIGNAAVYEKQPLVIVNATGHATAAEVVSIENAIVDSVLRRFGVKLTPEVEHI